MEDTGRPCPIGEFLLKEHAEKIEAASKKYGVGWSIALCFYVCPAVLGISDSTPDGRCAVRLRLLKLP